MTKSKVVLRLSIKDKKYGLIFNNNADAINYINQVTNQLQQHGMLRSLKKKSDNIYILTTEARRAVIAIQKSNCVIYKIRYYIDNTYQKTFESDNLDQLIALVHSKFNIDHDEFSSEDDILGVWTQSDDSVNIDEKYILSIDLNGETLAYIDLLASIESDSNPFIKPDLADHRKQEKLPHVGISYTHSASCYLWSTLLGPIGIVISTILTATYTNRIIKLYSNDYKISRHIGSIIAWRIGGAIAGVVTSLSNWYMRWITLNNDSIISNPAFYINPFLIIALAVMIVVGISMYNRALATDELIN